MAQRYAARISPLSFQRTDPANPTVPVGEPVLVTQGEDVPDWAPSSVVNALVAAGAIVAVADRPELVPDPLPPVGPDTPVIPASPVATAPLTVGDIANGTVPAPAGEVVTDPAAEPVVSGKPKERDSKEAWENYAASSAIGMPREQAESMRKADLITEVERIEAERATGGGSPSSTTPLTPTP